MKLYPPSDQPAPEVAPVSSAPAPVAGVTTVEPTLTVVKVRIEGQEVPTSDTAPAQPAATTVEPALTVANGPSSGDPIPLLTPESAKGILSSIAQQLSCEQLQSASFPAMLTESIRDALGEKGYISTLTLDDVQSGLAENLRNRPDCKSR